MKCKFCKCTDRKPCLIPMAFVPTPLVDELLIMYGVDYPAIVTRLDQVAEVTTPCHWSAPNICSAPACVDRAYREACELIDSLIDRGILEQIA